MRSKLLGCVLAGMLLTGCASAIERTLTGAQQGLAYDAYYTPTPGGDPRVLKFLEHRVEWLGIQLEYTETLDDERLQGAVGISFRIENARYILINGDTTINGRLEVLAHEAAHQFQPPLGTRDEHEVFADLVAVEVCRRLGVDISQTSSRYLQAHKHAFYIVKTWKQEIAYTADLLTLRFR